MSSLDFMQLCRLCLVKDGVSMSIFDGEGDVRQIFLKIASCLPVKVAREDKLPKKICDDCVYKVELLYQFWNTTLNADKQLRQWMGELNPEDKQGYVSDVLNTSAMKEVQATENRLDGNVIQHGGEHQNNMAMGMIDNMGLSIPIIMSNANQQQQITSVPMDTSGSSVQTVQALPGPSSQAAHNQISQNQTGTQHEDEDDTEDDENSDEECDGDDGLTVKEESEEEHNNRTVEPTTFVNVPLACDEAGPSGLQQQKISEIPEMSMPQSTDEDPKSEGSKFSVVEKYDLDAGEELSQELYVKHEVHSKFLEEPEERSTEESDEKYKDVMKKSILKERLMEKPDETKSLTRVMEKSMEDFKPENTEKHPYVLIRISRQPQASAAPDPNTTVEVATEAPAVSLKIQPISSANANSVILKKLPAILPKHGTSANKTASLLMKDQLSPPVGGFVVPPTNVNNNDIQPKVAWSSLGKDPVLASTLPQISKMPVIHQSAQIQNKLVPVRVIDSNGQSQVKNVLTPVVMPSAQLESNWQQARIQKIFGGSKEKRKSSAPSSTFTVQYDKPLIPCTAPVKDDEKTEKKVIILLTEDEVKYIENNRKRRELSKSVEEDEIMEIRPVKIEKREVVKVAQETEVETQTTAENEENLLNCDSSVCPICQKELKTAHLMRRHIRSIHKKTLGCDKCNKVYSTRQALVEHQKSHEDDFYLECSICHLRYKRKAGLRHHQIRVHSTIEAKYMCDHCGKRFKLKVDLGLHIEKIHMYSNHICKICGKLVKDVANHEWRHEMTASKASSRRYRCTLCPKKFSTRNNLDNHLLLHKDGFKCNHCDEIHQSQSSLVRHKAAKHRTTVMTCPVCEKSFNSSSNLHQHVLTHAGIRPYRCDVCDEDFTQRSSMLRHRRTHPGPLPPFTESTPIANIAKHVLEKLRNESKQNSDTE